MTAAIAHALALVGAACLLDRLARTAGRAHARRDLARQIAHYRDHMEAYEREVRG
jgi:hypothetical protein